MVGNLNRGSEEPPRSERKRSKRDLRGRATARGAMKKSRYVRVIEGKVRGNDPIEYLFDTGLGSAFLVPEGVMAVKVPQNQEISGGGMNGERKGVGSYIIRVGVMRRKRGKFRG